MATAQSIVLQAATLLQDLPGTRWPATELVRYLDEAQREIVRLRPDANAKTVPVTLIAGARQTLPSDAMVLIDIPNNAASKRMLRKCPMVTLDATLPNWQALRGAVDVVHFMHDLREPRVFYVYPPALATSQVDMVYAAYPQALPVPSGSTFASVTGNLEIAAQYASAAQDFVMYRAWSKDAEFAANAAMASAYFNQFNTAMGTQLQASATVAPQT